VEARLAKDLDAAIQSKAVRDKRLVWLGCRLSLSHPITRCLFFLRLNIKPDTHTLFPSQSDSRDTHPSILPYPRPSTHPSRVMKKKLKELRKKQRRVRLKMHLPDDKLEDTAAGVFSLSQLRLTADQLDGLVCLPVSAVCLLCLPACLPACLLACLPDWLAGWLAAGWLAG